MAAFEDEVSRTFLTFNVAEGEAVLSGNRLGLLRLAAQLVELADAPVDGHLHYDAASELAEPATIPLVISRVATWEDDTSV